MKRLLRKWFSAKPLILLVFASMVATGCSDSDGGSSPVAPDSQKAAANFIASQFKADPDFLYEDHFSPEFRKTHTEEEVKEKLASVFQDLGACREAILASDQVGDSGRRNWFLRFDTRREVMQLYANPKNGLIEIYELTGDIPLEQYFSISEPMVPMTDGTRLRTLVFQKADASEPKPVVLIRTPYFEWNGLFIYSTFYGMAEYFLERGYNFVAQSIRGKTGSEGVYKHMNPIEIDDGYDTVVWLAGEAFCDGRVGITGTSYDGFTSLAAGIRNPFPLKVILVGGAPSNIATDGFRFDGPMATSYLNYIAYNVLEQGYYPQDDFAATVAELCMNESNLADYDELVYGADLAEWNRIAAAYPDPDAALWKERQIFTRLPEIQVPTWHISGMKVDGDLPDTIRNFVTIQENSPFAASHRLMIGFWDHGNSTPYGRGNNLKPYWKDRYDPIMAFFLKGETTPYVNEPRVQMASLLSEDFISADQWPMPQLREKTLFFNRTGDALTLNERLEGDTDESSYLFKPLELRQSDENQYLAFKWSPTRKVNLLGPITFRVYVSVDRPQTDIFLLFVKQNDQGEVVFFTTPAVAKKIINTQDVMLLEISCGPVMNVMTPDETLTVWVLSNCFPHMFRNRNNDVGPGYYDHFSDARITFYHSAQYPSRMTFSVQ